MLLLLLFLQASVGGVHNSKVVYMFSVYSVYFQRGFGNKNIQKQLETIPGWEL